LIQEQVHSSAISLVTNSEKFESATEISLLDIVQFAMDSWKKLALAAIVGLLIGVGSWFAFGSYSAQTILLNNSNGLDLVSWKAIQKSLPNLAAQVVEDGKIPLGQEDLYRTLSHEDWWLKNAIPSFAISKMDTKDLAEVNKDFDAAATTILSLTINAGGSSKEAAIEATKAAAKFLRTGGAYLQLRSILSSYEGETISAVAELQKKMTTTQIEMGYQQQHAKSLEELYKRYPSNSSAGQVVDAKDSGAKYLSITTQIVAIQNDINQSKENLQRLRDRLTQLALVKKFLGQAAPLVESTYDGLVLGEGLLDIEHQLRATIAKDDMQQQEILDQIDAQLLQVAARFTKGLEANTLSTSKKAGLLKSAAGGLLGAFFLMLCLLLGQRAWRGMNGELAKRNAVNRDTVKSEIAQ